MPDETGSPRGEVGLVDTNVVIYRDRIDSAELPEQLAICTVTLAELSAGPHFVDASEPDAVTERARRIDLLQRTEHEFDPIDFDAAAARAFGVIAAAVLAAGRSPRRRTADLMIASVARANRLPLYTTNPKDFAGLGDLVTVRAVRRPEDPRARATE